MVSNLSINRLFFNPITSTAFLLLLIFLAASCGSKAKTESAAEVKSEKVPVSKSEPKTEAERIEIADKERSKGAMIKIKENSPADTVRVFYKRLRAKQFREAIMLTNLRPAIEGLTDSEMKDLGVDFGFLAQRVPENMPINGEIVTGDTATVTVKFPNEETKKLETAEIKLRKDKDIWIVLVADGAGEKMAKREGKNYFFALRMDVHHKEAKAMLDRIGKAQMIYSMKNNGKFGNLETLINKGFVPQDAKTPLTTGYKYDVLLAEDHTTYTAVATPAEYGKTGKLSFALKITKDKQPELIFKDLKGRPLKN
ncbi:MAG: hypothetical protein HKN25_14745 [Pyrinomonadaceae bacterium]|nr:hypothetical protein [Pyrinomonadaceae bacterium]